MEKKILIGKAKEYGKVVVTIELKKVRELFNWETLFKIDPERDLALSISASARGAWGQMVDTIREMEWIERNIDESDLLLLLEYWKEYHLNDTQAGTKLQMECIEFAKANPTIKWDAIDHFNICRHILNQHCLNMDTETNPARPYIYGTQWLYKPIPTHVISFISNLQARHDYQQTRSELLDWIISENIKFKISRADSNPNMDSNAEMDHWLCEFWKENNPKKIFKCNYSTGIGHRIGNRRMTNQQITLALTKWRRKVYGSFGLPFPTFTTDKNKVSLRELGFDCRVPTMVFSHDDIYSIPVPPMPDDVLNCIARETMDCENHGDWMDWATDLGYDLNSKSERRKLQKAFITMQDQADSFSSVFRNFPFALVE